MPSNNPILLLQVIIALAVGIELCLLVENWLKKKKPTLVLSKYYKLINSKGGGSYGHKL